MNGIRLTNSLPEWWGSIRKRRDRYWGLLVAVVIVLVSGCFVFAALSLGAAPQYPDWVPEPVVNSFFDFRLEVAPLLKKFASISSGTIRDKRIYLDTYGERVELNHQNLQLVGTLYQPDGNKPAPGIVLVHGSSPEGRLLGIYRYMGRALSERGYLVFTIDLRGYGESSDPALDGEPNLLDTALDLRLAVDYLSSLNVLDPDRVYVIGHSGGSREALVAGVEDNRIRKVILIGPPRRVDERIISGSNNEFDYFRRRLMRYMRFNSPIPADVYLEYSRTMQLENHLDYLEMPSHKPLLLIDGELEDQADRSYLKEFFESISEPKDYRTIPGADHYVNIANFGSIVIYDTQVADDLVDEVTNWMAEKELNE